MPRPRERVDTDVDTGVTATGGGPPQRGNASSNDHTFFGNPMYALSRVNAVAKQAALLAKSHVADMDLDHLESRLNEEVDEDVFEEPRRFNSLPRVIDVLGAQMIDDATTAVDENSKNLPLNPAYKNLKAQQKAVEDAIEHMAVIYCADLNASVISEGRVARQFTEAVDKVRNLRKQVREIQDSLGPASHIGNQNNNGGAAGSSRWM
jgi:hypothetical protein